jgi:hypothetical protein
MRSCSSNRQARHNEWRTRVGGNTQKIRGAMRNPQWLSPESSGGRRRGSFRSDWAFSAVVTRLNYANHGAANRVVLDTGNILHTKRKGMARLKLKVGDTVVRHRARRGGAQTLITVSGKAIEAIRINGKLFKRV